MPFLIYWIIMKKFTGISCSTILQLAHSVNVLAEISDEQTDSLGLWYTFFPNVTPCDPKKKFMWIILIYYENCKKLRVEKFCYCSTTILSCVYNICSRCEAYRKAGWYFKTLRESTALHLVLKYNFVPVKDTILLYASITVSCSVTRVHILMYTIQDVDSDYLTICMRTHFPAQLISLLTLL